MSKKTITIISVLALGLSNCALASIVVDTVNGTGSHITGVTNVALTVSNLNNPDASVITAPTSALTAKANGSLTKQGWFGAGESFSYTAVGKSGWDDTAITSPFNDYVSGLTAGTIDFRNASNAVDGSMGANGTNIGLGDALVFTFDTSLLTGDSQLQLVNVDFANGGATELADIYLWSAASNTFFTASTNVATGDVFDFGSVAINSGDILVVAGSTGSSFKVRNMTVDVIPEPATLGMVAAVGVGILFIRRRFMI